MAEIGLPLDMQDLPEVSNEDNLHAKSLPHVDQLAVTPSLSTSLDLVFIQFEADSTEFLARNR